MSTPRIVAAVTPSDGDGIPVVLGPGLGTTTTVWDAVRDRLAARHPVLVWDLPGHGASPAPTRPFTVEDLADGVLAAVDEADIGRFAVAGNSFGGLTALAIALAAPERVSHVAMVCSLPRLGDRDGWLQRAETVRRQGTPVMVAGSAERWFAPGFIAAQPALAGRLLDELMTIDDEGYARCCEALAEADLRDRLPELRAPLTLIEGADDVVVDLDTAAAIVDAVPGARLHVVQGAGHQAPAERPAEVAALLADAIEEAR